MWKQILRRPVLAAMRSGEIAAGFVYASPSFQRLRAAFWAGTQAPSVIRTAVIAHVYYLDLWGEILALRATLPLGSPIIVTVPSCRAVRFREMVGDDSSIEIIERPNRGRDIAPFLFALQSGALDRFDVVLKIHTKKSPHLRQGDLRRRVYFTALAGSRSATARVLAQFSDPKVGLVGPGAYFRTAPDYWMANKRQVEELATKIEARVGLGFFEGSMFWVRPAALSSLKVLNIDLDAFEPETGQLDGTLHHAIERIFALAVSRAGYETRTIGARLLMPAESPLGLPEVPTFK